MKNVKSLLAVAFVLLSVLPAMSKTSERVYFDAEAYDLKGHVKECGTDSFAIDGAIVIEGIERIEREGNRLARIVFEDTPLTEVWTEFIWVDDRLMERNYSSIDTSGAVEDFAGATEYSISSYTYDNNGYVSEMVWSDGKATSETYRYEYLEFDDHGNWIKRRCVIVVEGFDENIEIETREISYYE